MHFLAVDRINMLIAVAPNPGVFETVEEWIDKLDIPAKVAAGAVDTYVYAVRYGRNDCLAMPLNQLFNPATAVMPGAGMGGYGAGSRRRLRELRIWRGRHRRVRRSFWRRRMAADGGGYGGTGGYGEVWTAAGGGVRSRE